MEWLDGLDAVTRAKIRIRLDRVRLGNLGRVRHVGEGVHEFKIDYGPGTEFTTAQAEEGWCYCYLAAIRRRRKRMC